MAQTNTMAITEPSSLMDFVMNKGHGVKGLSETGLKTLPPQYVQPIQERINADDALAAEGEGQTIIPIIDMSSAAELMICEAAERWGFFQVVNHGVPLEVLEKVLAAARRFFAMPAEEKNKYSKENSPSNNVRYGTSFTPHAEEALEWKDFLSLFYVSHEEAYDLWPLSCREEAIEFMKKSEVFIKKLLEVLMKRLNVKEIDTIERENLLMGSKRINMNYYPICPNPNLTVGVGRHSDVSTLTVLLQDVIGGLYVRDHEKIDTWIHVPPIKGSLVINVGDVLQIISNGRYKSAEHRVAANGSSDRISVPIFVNPRPSDIISPLPEVLASSGEKPIYKEVLYSDYVKHFFRKAHDGKSTIDFASIKV